MNKKVCAWCKAVMQEGVEPISHGMCEKCAEEQLRKIFSECITNKEEEV